MPDSLPSSAATDDRARVWRAAEDLGAAMLVTASADGMMARPMSAIIRADEGMIYFLSDAGTEKIEDIAEYPNVAVTFSDAAKTHVAFRGTATVTADRAKIHELWSPAADAFYPEGADDPTIRLITVEPLLAEMWESPGRLLALIQMVGAVATGKSARDIGDHIKTEL